MGPGHGPRGKVNFDRWIEALSAVNSAREKLDKAYNAMSVSNSPSAETYLIAARGLLASALDRIR